MASQKDTKDRINSVKNIQKVTRAMEMVAAARLRRAEQRIEAMRPYADAIRRMTGRVVEAVERIPDMPLLEEHDETKRVGILLVTGDRGLAGPFNSQIMRAGMRRERELRDEGKEVVWFASGKRGVSSLSFRGKEVVVERLHSEISEVLDKMGDGDWSDEIQKKLDEAIAQFAKDFGYDLDEEGQPLEDDSPDRDTRDRSKSDSDDDDDSDDSDDSDDETEETKEREGATA